MKKHILSLLFLGVLFSHSTIAAQNCSIQGTLPGAEGRVIFLLRTMDYLSEEMQEIQKQRVDDRGSFSFNFQIDRITPVTLSVNFYETTFFAVPGESYTLKGGAFYFDDFVNPFIMKPTLPLYLSEINELNRFIADFNQRADDFSIKKYREILNSQNLAALDELYVPVDRLPEKYRSFCDDYQIFSIGSMKASYSRKRAQKLGETYLAKKKPDIHDYCYMMFFNAYFTNYFPDHNHNIEAKAVQTAVETQANLSTFLTELKKEPVLNDENICALYAIKLLRDVPFKKTEAINMLMSVQHTDLSDQAKEAAANVLQAKKRLAPGTKVPDFSLQTVSGETVNNQSFIGKYVYINFFKTNCVDCVNDMEMMRDLYAKNKQFFEFVSICVDNQYLTFENFSNARNYPWKVVYAGYNQEFIQQWQVKTFPYYILLDAANKIVNYPTLSPEDGIAPIMEKITWESIRKLRQ